MHEIKLHIVFGDDLPLNVVLSLPPRYSAGNAQNGRHIH